MQTLSFSNHLLRNQSCLPLTPLFIWIMRNTSLNKQNDLWNYQTKTERNN